MGPKIVSSPIIMQTESPNFGQRFDPFWVHKWPVSTEVQSHFRTFVAVDLNLKNFSYKTFTTHHSPSFPISPEWRTTSCSPNDNPFGIARLTISLNNCQGTFVYSILRLMAQGFLNMLDVSVLGNIPLSTAMTDLD